jgi:hypothetical protein
MSNDLGLNSNFSGRCFGYFLLFGLSGFGASTKVNTFDLWARVVWDLEFFFLKGSSVFPAWRIVLGFLLGPFAILLLTKFVGLLIHFILVKVPFCVLIICPLFPL